MADDQTGSMETAPMLRQILEEIREFKGSVESKFVSIDARFVSIDARLDSIDAKLESHDSRLDRLERSLRDVHKTLDRFQEYELRRLNEMDDRLARLEERAL